MEGGGQSSHRTGGKYVYFDLTAKNTIFNLAIERDPYKGYFILARNKLVWSAIIHKI